MVKSLKVSAPGRICLFGEHQDFLGLPVIAAAIDLRIHVEGTARPDRRLKITMPDIVQSEEINLSAPIVYERKRDYLRSCVNVLKRTGWDLDCGFDCRIRSTIPINAGVSSSSALIVAFLKFLIEAVQIGDRFTPYDLAKLAHQAEVVEFGEPGGMMDHFASALGSIIHVDCRPPFAARHLPVSIEGFVLGDSLEKKQTLGVLSGSRTDVEEGLRMLKERLPGFDLHTTPADDILPLIEQLPERIARKVRANIINRDLTVQAMDMFTHSIDPPMLGALLTRHHEQLSQGIGVSTPKMDRMLQSALDAGALGGKMNGSGGGGCMFAYAPGNETAVMKALEAAGGKAYKLAVDSGARLEASV